MRELWLSVVDPEDYDEDNLVLFIIGDGEVECFEPFFLALEDEAGGGSR